jgi:hypothetical protein
MTNRAFVAAFAVITLGSVAIGAPLPRKVVRKRPAVVAKVNLERFKSHSRFARLNHLSVETKGLVQTDAHESSARLRTFPQWKGSFTYQGKSYPYVMAGGNPMRGDETRLDTSFIALSFKFDEFADADGNPIVIDTTPSVGEILGSPNFVQSRYSVGFGQFGDAVQRASFFNVAERDWHTTLDRPRILTPVTIEVPPGMGTVDQVNGKYLGTVDFDFLYSQLQTILQLENIRTDELPILVSRNVSTNYALGFHDAIDVQVGNKKGIQTYTWTSWYDADVVPEIFADATTLTHEISEWIGDPLVNNVVPEFVIPESGTPPFCMDVLEVGDPIEFLATQMYPVTIRGHVYHTQNETLVPWFSREVPSSAFHGAYSYPDTTVLTAPSDPCPPATP